LINHSSQNPTRNNCINNLEQLSLLGLSDHCILKFTCNLEIDQVTFADKFNLDKGAYAKLREFLNVNWDYLLDARGNTLDEMWDTFTSLITEGMNAFVPKHLHRSINSKKIQPFNADLRHSVHRKYRLWNHWIKSRNDQVYKNTRLFAIKLNGKLLSLFRKSKLKYRLNSNLTQRDFGSM